jgi:D-glycero-D-manno-heptose 1,7-bisphosphate phosphatase
VGRPAVFLDRDGVLIREGGYLAREEDLVLLPGAGEACGRLKGQGYLLVVVTNQSGVARGFFDEDFVRATHVDLSRRLGEGAPDGWFYCPHHPVEGVPPYRRECDCRKPRPGMVFAARDRWGIDLSRSWMIGDGVPDLGLAVRAGLKSILVRTGKGAETEVGLRRGEIPAELAPLAVVPDLPSAAERLARISDGLPSLGDSDRKRKAGAFFASGGHP